MKLKALILGICLLAVVGTVYYTQGNDGVNGTNQESQAEALSINDFDFPFVLWH